MKQLFSKTVLLSTLVSFAAISSTTQAKQYYKWVDNQGSTHYTTTPPPKNARSKSKVNTYGYHGDSAPVATHSNPPTAPVSTQSTPAPVNTPVNTQQNSQPTNQTINQPTTTQPQSTNHVEPQKQTQPLNTVQK